MKLTDMLLIGGIGFVAYELYKGQSLTQIWNDVPVIPGLVSSLTTNTTQLLNSGSQTAQVPTHATIVMGDQVGQLPMGMAGLGLGLYGALIPNAIYGNATSYEKSAKFYR